MAREIIHVQVGECGNRIGTAFWQRLGAEHKLDQTGQFVGKDVDEHSCVSKIGVYYNEAKDKEHTYVPRACVVDLDPSTADVISASSIGALFKPDNMCFGPSGTGNLWFVHNPR